MQLVSNFKTALKTSGKILERLCTGPSVEALQRINERLNKQHPGFSLSFNWGALDQIHLTPLSNRYNAMSMILNAHADEMAFRDLAKSAPHKQEHPRAQ